MELLMGPSFSIEASPTTTPAQHHQEVAPQAVLSAPPCLFVAKEEDGGSEGSPISSRVGSGIGLTNSPEESSDSSSSIGAPDDSDEEDDGTVVSSSSKDVVGSLDSLEEALPIKRGLSNYYSGKSKSFGNLAYVNSANITKNLEKPENPFNKRRRLLIANKWSRRSFYSWSNPKSMPLLTLKEDQDEDGEDDYRDSGNEGEQSPSSSSSSSGTQEQRVLHKQSTAHELYQRRLGATLKSQSCFSLADLQEEEQYHE